jgi:DNA-binding transcriptional regulator YhcF (GntR family)
VTVNFDDRSPIYRQIADRIEAEVLSGALAGDEQVMSTNKYAAFHRINPATVNKAFQQLVDDGILYKRRGIGMFVSPQARQTLRARRRKTFFSDVVDPMVAQARAIGIDMSELVERINQLAREDSR